MPVVPTKQSLPTQEPGTRLTRPLNYNFDITSTVSPDGKSITLSLKNIGSQGAVFFVYDTLSVTSAPHKYTVEGGKSLSDVLNILDPKGRYGFSVHGPNGYVHQLSGSPATQPLSVTMRSPLPCGCSHRGQHTRRQRYRRADRPRPCQLPVACCQRYDCDDAPVMCL
mmetsp:Transcript_22769/g.49508  ORF Transcript_22769/g.49508 Transcript_22769/m.49508 type:complete len:167 (+) Transcript_22769:761-1261(+)